MTKQGGRVGKRFPERETVSDTYRREVGIPFRLDSNPNLRDSMGVGTDIGACRSSGGTARRGRAATFGSCSEVARRVLCGGDTSECENGAI